MGLGQIGMEGKDVGVGCDGNVAEKGLKSSIVLTMGWWIRAAGCSIA
jgi:hypothetical protein